MLIAEDFRGAVTGAKDVRDFTDAQQTMLYRLNVDICSQGLLQASWHDLCKTLKMASSTEDVSCAVLTTAYRFFSVCVSTHWQTGERLSGALQLNILTGLLVVKWGTSNWPVLRGFCLQPLQYNLFRAAIKLMTARGDKY
eukprot:1142640-Pelagomonas_calceolata.AAC.7